ncbi:MAG: methyltransferase family protein [Promethearchaeota archaeon]
MKNKSTNDEINKKLRNSRIMSKIGVMIMNIFIFICFFYIFFYEQVLKVIPRLNIVPLSDILQIIGFLLIIGGNITLFLAYRELGENWAYPLDGGTIKRNLITTGIYSQVRHPIYLSFNIFSIGFILLLLDWILLILYIIGAIGLYSQAIDEERILLDYFGINYKNYMESTGRFFVKVKKK